MVNEFCYLGFPPLKGGQGDVESAGLHHQRFFKANGTSPRGCVIMICSYHIVILSIAKDLTSC